MTKYIVSGIGYYDCSVIVEANSPEEAEELASSEISPSLCHQCDGPVQLGDIQEYTVEKID